MELDIDERHLLRMGHGEEGLETDKDFSRSVSYLTFSYIRSGSSLNTVVSLTSMLKEKFFYLFRV